MAMDAGIRMGGNGISEPMPEMSDRAVGGRRRRAGAAHTAVREAAVLECDELVHGAPS
jgi:hypothetical protein